MRRPELIKAYRDNGDQIPSLMIHVFLSRILRFLGKPCLMNCRSFSRPFYGFKLGRAAGPVQELNVMPKRHAILSVKSGSYWSGLSLLVAKYQLWMSAANF